MDVEKLVLPRFLLKYGIVHIVPLNISGKINKVNPKHYGTKCAAHYKFTLQPGEEVVIKVRLYQSAEAPKGYAFSKEFEEIFERRKLEADMFYDEVHWISIILPFLSNYW